LKECQEVRASFDIKGKTENVAKKLSLSTMKEGTGGSGTMDEDVNRTPVPGDMNQDMPSDTSPGQPIPDQGPSSTLPEEPGTPPMGGSGSSGTDTRY
jgi:hypothetical protein